MRRQAQKACFISAQGEELQTVQILRKLLPDLGKKCEKKLKKSIKIVKKMNPCRVTQNEPKIGHGVHFVPSSGHISQNVTNSGSFRMTEMEHTFRARLLANFAVQHHFSIGHLLVSTTPAVAPSTQPRQKFRWPSQKNKFLMAVKEKMIGGHHGKNFGGRHGKCF